LGLGLEEPLHHLRRFRERGDPALAKTSWVFVTFGDSGSRKQIATSEERVANWKILVNQCRNEHSCRNWLSHHLVFTKNDEEPISFTPHWSKGNWVIVEWH
jgi:hypothetical protein